MRIIRAIFFLVLITIPTIGQDLEITIKVIDKETNKPVPNANVIVSGTTRGTFTNSLGFFKLALSPAETQFVVSHVSYKSVPITVPEGTTVFTVPMEKMIYTLSPIDLHLYPTKFNTADLRPAAPETPRLDSMVVVESTAYFPYVGGTKTFAALFGNEFQFPERELFERPEGRQFFSFTIDRNGDYKNVRCLINETSGFCTEFKRIISEMPKWKPGEQRGEPVEQEFYVPIYHGLNDYWKKKMKEIKKRDK